MLSEEEQEKRRINHLYWSMPARARLSLMLLHGFITDNDARQVPHSIYARAIERAIENGDLRDLQFEIERELQREAERNVR